MTLRIKTLVISGTIGVFVLSTLFLLTRGLLLDSFSELERAYVTQYLQRAEATVSAEAESLQTLTGDYACWDDTYQFIHRPTPGYVRANLDPAYTVSLPLDLMAFLDRQGRIVHLADLRAVGPRQPVRRTELRQLLAAYPQLLRTASPEDKITGPLLVSGKPLLLAAHAITNNHMDARPNGVLLFGRWLEPIELARQARLGDNSIQLGATPLGVPPPPTPAPGAGPVPAVIEALGTDLIVGKMVLHDLLRRPSIMLSVSGPRRFYHQGVAASHRALMIVVSTCLCLLLVLMLSQERLVLSRLFALQASLQDIGRRSDPAARVPVSGRDELASVGHAVNDVLGALETSQRERRESAERFRDIALSMSDALWESDREGRYTYFSPRLAETLDRGEKEIRGRPVASFVAPESVEEFTPAFGRALREQQALNGLESWVLRPDGTRLCRQTNAVPFWDADGHFLGLRGVDRNITSRKSMEEALRHSERRFRGMANLLPDILLEVDEDLNVTYANSAAFATCGYDMGEADGRLRLEDLLDADALALLADEVAAASHGRAPGIRTYRVHRKDGSTFACEVHFAAIHSSDGIFCGLRGVGRDVSAREELEQAHRMATVGHLATGVAHEFNNILSGLMGQAELSKHHCDRSDCRMLANTVIRGAERGAGICLNLLRFARPRRPAREAVPVETPLEAALSMAHRELANAEITLQRHYDTRGHCAFADPAQLEQVALNLIINACHAMPQGGVLWVGTSYVPSEGGPGEVVVKIVDTGVGIRPDDLPHIFEPFFTTKRTAERGRSQGTGLGLSVAMGIVSAHGGTLCAESEPGRGTSFELRLAACSEYTIHHPKKEETILGASSTDSTAYRVLLAEDDEAIRRTLQSLLELKGYTVSFAENTQDTLKLLAEDEYDLVISDYLMPGGGGREILQFLNDQGKDPAIIMITGLADEQLFAELTSNGVDRCLSKPFRLASLVETIEAIMSERRAS